jgi:hypothetical protein
MKPSLRGAKRRGNPESRKLGKRWFASSQGLLAMTADGSVFESER